MARVDRDVQAAYQAGLAAYRAGACSAAYIGLGLGLHARAAWRRGWGEAHRQAMVARYG